MLRGYWFLSVLAAVLVMVGAGCDKRAALPEVSQVFVTVDECLRGGDTNRALTVLTRAMAEKGYAQSRSGLYACYLNILLVGRRLDEAKGHYLGVIGSDEALIRSGFDVLSGYCRAQGGEVHAAWMQQMMQAKLPADLLAQVYAEQARAFLDKGQVDKMAELVPVCVAKFSADLGRQILGGAVRTEMDAGRFAVAGTLLDAIDKCVAADRTLKDMSSVLRGDILFMKGDWAAAEAMFGKVAATVSDGDLSGWLPVAVGRCVGKGQLDLADGLCDVVLKTQAAKVGARAVAARQWMMLADVRKNVALIPVRLESLKELGISTDVLYSLFLTTFYGVLAGDKKEDVGAMIAFGDKLMAALTNADEKGDVRAMMLDGSVIVEDFARAKQILTIGIPERDKQWHEVVMCKVNAHLAIQAGNYKEAVACLRQFMAGVGAWERPEQDPITGVFYSKEMCLGRQAKRIGDVWTKAGEVKAAGEAYAEAKGYYAKALADVEADSKEAGVIKSDLSGIPVGN